MAIIYNEFCGTKACPEYIEWTFESMGEYAHCTSCQKIGQSYDITEYPPDCPFIEEISKLNSNP